MSVLVCVVIVLEALEAGFYRGVLNGVVTQLQELAVILKEHFLQILGISDNDPWIPAVYILQNILCGSLIRNADNLHL